MLAYLLLVLGIVTRLILHTPNFTPIISIALFSGFYVNKKYAAILPLILMAITDIIIGFHNTMLFTWGSILLISLIGLGKRQTKSFSAVFFSNIFAAVLFFIVTNFGVWLMSGWYSPNLSGLLECYTLAIPFFRMTLLSTIVYSFVLFGLYEVVAIRIKNTKLATVLL